MSATPDEDDEDDDTSGPGEPGSGVEPRLPRGLRPQPPAPDRTLRAAIVSVFACGLLFAMVGFAFFGVREGFGVLIGGLIATANLFVFARVAQAFVERRGNTAPWGVIALLKLVLLFGGVLLVLRGHFVSAPSLAAGYAALPFGITFASLFGPAPTEDDPSATQSTRRRGNVIEPRRKGPDGSNGSERRPRS